MKKKNRNEKIFLLNHSDIKSIYTQVGVFGLYMSLSIVVIHKQQSFRETLRVCLCHVFEMKMKAVKKTKLDIREKYVAAKKMKLPKSREMSSTS